MLPDRATAPPIAALVSQTGVAMNKLLIVARPTGTAIQRLPARPISPASTLAVDESGYQPSCPQYQQRFWLSAASVRDARLYGGDPRQCLQSQHGLAA